MFSQISWNFMFYFSFSILERSLRLPAARIRNHGSPSCWSARSSLPRSRTVACWATRRLYMHCIRITCVLIPWVTIWTTSEWTLSWERICFRLSIYVYYVLLYILLTVKILWLSSTRRSRDCRAIWLPHGPSKWATWISVYICGNTLAVSRRSIRPRRIYGTIRNILN